MEANISYKHPFLHLINFWLLTQIIFNIKHVFGLFPLFFLCLFLCFLSLSSSFLPIYQNNNNSKIVQNSPRTSWCHIDSPLTVYVVSWCSQKEKQILEDLKYVASSKKSAIIV